MPCFGKRLGTIPTDALAIFSSSVGPEPRRMEEVRPATSLGLVLKSHRRPKFRDRLGFTFQLSCPKKPKLVDRKPILCWERSPVRKSKLIPGSNWTLSLAKLKIPGTLVPKKL